MERIDVDSRKPFAIAAGDVAIGDLVDPNSGEVVSNGVILVTKGSAAALTLRAPYAGPRNAGGEDGRELEVVAGTANAHTITTPDEVVNGTSDLITLGGAIGDSVRLFAYNGIWYARRSEHETPSDPS